MLSIFDGQQGLSRRRMLSIGSLGLGGLTLQSLMAAASKGASLRGPLTGKSVIFLFQQGGPSQLETFDPKVEAPVGIRTITDVMQTSVPGVTFGEPMSSLAKLAHKLTVVRSYQTNNAGHNIQPMVGPDSLETNIGVHYSRIAGTTHPETGMPTNAVLYPQAVSREVMRGSARGDLTATGNYGSGYTPFVPGAGGQLQKDMQVTMPRDRFFSDRRQLLAQLDRLNRRVDATGQIASMDDIQRQAYELLLGGGVADALDLSKEDSKTVAAYDTGRFAKKGQWQKTGRGKRGYYYGQASSVGKLLLLARRLCEAGCGFVTVHASYAGVWDMHADGNNLNMIDGMHAVGRPFAHAVAAFIADLESRGLQDKILLIASGEMGRTPRINKRGGRDHWGKLAPLLLYGGGISGGKVIGQSTRTGGEPSTDPITPKHLISTILHTVCDVGELRIKPGVPRPILKLSEAPPIPGLS